ncbi:MAG: hypothetical protein AAFX55_01380 [Bacteroidota bacterium]
MYKTSSWLLILIITSFIFSCSDNDSEDNPQILSENQIIMFPGIVSGSITLGSEEDNLIHIRGNSTTNTVDFITIDELGNRDIIDVTSIFSQLPQFLNTPIFYAFNNQIVILGQSGSNPNMATSLITLDYNGNFINEAVIVQNPSFFYEYKLTDEEIIMYAEEFTPEQGNFLDYKRFNKSGNLISEGVIDLNDNYLGIEDISVENGEIYISGKNNYISTEDGFQRQFCAKLSTNNELIDVISWNQTDNVNNSSIVSVESNRIHRVYRNNNNAIIDIYNLGGNLIASKSYDGLYINNSFTYSQNKFLIASLNFNASKEFDFQVFDNSLNTELFSSNYGASNSIDGTSESPLISRFIESENFYTIVGQTDATRSGDFDLPENSSSFDTYIIRFRKN